MITGIDLLFVIFGFILLILLVEAWDRYNSWAKWDRGRRRGRQLYRYELQDDWNEKVYRAYLRRLLSPGFIAVMHRTTRSIDKVNQTLLGEKV